MTCKGPLWSIIFFSMSESNLNYNTNKIQWIIVIIYAKFKKSNNHKCIRHLIIVFNFMLFKMTDPNIWSSYMSPFSPFRSSKCKITIQSTLFPSFNCFPDQFWSSLPLALLLILIPQFLACPPSGLCCLCPNHLTISSHFLSFWG